MDFRPRTEPEIHQIAESIILGHRSLADYQDLGRDDRARVDRLVERGSDALGALERKAQVQKRQLRGRLGRSATGTALVSSAPEADLGDLMSQLPVPGFDVDQLHREAPSVRFGFLDRLSRVLSPQELSIYAGCLSAEQLRRLLDGVSDRQREQWESAAGVPDAERQAVSSKVAWVAVQFLQDAEDLMPETQAYLDKYRAAIAEHLFEYSCQLVEGLGISQRMSAMDARQTRILVGLTPRDELARFAPALGEEHLGQLLKQLPERQRQELSEAQAHYSRRREEDLREFVPLFAALKTWGATVRKARES